MQPLPASLPKVTGCWKMRAVWPAIWPPAARRQEASGIAYFFNMVLILGVLAAIGGVVLLLGLAYLSRDFSTQESWKSPAG